MSTSSETFTSRDIESAASETFNTEETNAREIKSFGFFYFLVIFPFSL